MEDQTQAVGLRACVCWLCLMVAFYSPQAPVCLSHQGLSNNCLSKLHLHPSNKQVQPPAQWPPPLCLMKSVSENMQSCLSPRPPHKFRVNSYLDHFCISGSQDKASPRPTSSLGRLQIGYIHPPNTSVPTLCQAFCRHSGCNNGKTKQTLSPKVYSLCTN